MTSVVTGANGFAGRWLCKALVQKEATVVGWVRALPPDPIPGVSYRVQDIRDADGCAAAMRDDQPDTVFHLAAMTHLADCEAHPAAAHVTNVVGTRNVFQAMPASVRGVFSSTCHVYGQPKSKRISETHPTAPKGVYAESKLEAELEIRRLGRNVAIARAFHHTGPGQSTRYVLADWAAQIRSGQSTVRVGDLNLRRDFSDVRDIVQGYIHLATSDVEPGVYNLCSGVAPTLRSMFEQLRGERACEAICDPSRVRPLDVPIFCGDPSLALSVGVPPVRSIQKTLNELV